MLKNIPAWAGAYVGARYIKAGRARETGFDCIGLYLSVVQREAGIALPEYDGPPWEGAKSVRALGAAAEAFAERFVEVERGREVCFDAILLRMRRQPIHIGCVLAPGLMLHIEEGCDAVIESYRSVQWCNSIEGFYRPLLKMAA